jgi:hypothetical protein
LHYSIHVENSEESPYGKLWHCIFPCSHRFLERPFGVRALDD